LHVQAFGFAMAVVSAARIESSQAHLVRQGQQRAEVYDHGIEHDRGSLAWQGTMVA
jgi:hypothetical protein